jgi:hypothetical protein
MTLLDGHGRTPHDTLEQTLSGAAMLCCLPCLCVLAGSKFFTTLVEKVRQFGEPKSGRKREERETEGGIDPDAPTLSKAEDSQSI